MLPFWSFPLHLFTDSIPSLKSHLLTALSLTTMPARAIIAWGGPVDPCSSIAHLVAYAEYKTAIETFLACVQPGRQRGQAIGTLAQKIIDMISERVDPRFETHRQRWLPLLKCYQNKCSCEEVTVLQRWRGLLHRCYSADDPSPSSLSICRSQLNINSPCLSMKAF